MNYPLTPITEEEGILLKREDLYTGEFGVNGAKWRACRNLVNGAYLSGATEIISAASVRSPQSAMASVAAKELGIRSVVIVGATTPEKAVKHKPIAIAKEAGAEIVSVGSGFNSTLQKSGRDLVASSANNAWLLPYGISTPPDATVEEIRDFLSVGAPQVNNIPAEVETLVLPFGSGNTAAGVLYGLHQSRPENLKKIVLVGIGPDRLTWLKDRLALLGLPVAPEGVELEHVSLHGWFATYDDLMHENLGSVALHPTYEGKVVRFLNQLSPDYWTRRDGTTLLWIVGGPL